MSNMDSFFSGYLSQAEKLGFDLKKLEEIYNKGILKGYEAGISDDNVEYYAEGY